MQPWQKSKVWADTYTKQVISLLRSNAATFVKIAEASPEDDARHNTDFVVKVEGGEVSCRIRDSKYRKYQDITIRNSRATGAQTEADKILLGYGRWMFYGFAQNGLIGEWLLVSLDCVREKAIIQRVRQAGRIRANRDGGSTLLSIPLRWLRDSGAIVAESLLCDR